MTAQVITCEILNISGQLNFMMTVVYAYNTKEDRRPLWSYLYDLSQIIQLPWLVAGDFNAMMRQDDRIGGNPILMGKMIEFQECIEDSGLIELPHFGSRYTWSDRHGDSRIWSKIDWAFVNREWIDMMPTYTITFLPEGTSAHCAIHMALENIDRAKKKPFKYCNTWSTHPSFLQIVKEVWGRDVKGCKMVQIVRKLKELRRKLKALNSTHFSHIVEEANEDMKALEIVQKALHLHPTDLSLQQEEKGKFLKFKQSSYLTVVYLQQRSKAMWIRLGDDNTKYFFSIIKRKSLPQAIIQLVDNMG